MIILIYLYIIIQKKNKQLKNSNFKKYLAF